MITESAIPSLVFITCYEQVNTKQRPLYSLLNQLSISSRIFNMIALPTHNTVQILVPSGYLHHWAHSVPATRSLYSGYQNTQLLVVWLAISVFSVHKTGGQTSKTLGNLSIDRPLQLALLILDCSLYTLFYNLWLQEVSTVWANPRADLNGWHSSHSHWIM